MPTSARTFTPTLTVVTHPLGMPLELPCGAVLLNRLAKAAMSEGLADSANHSTPRLETLYRRWAGSGTGLLLSGNIQVDRHHLERPNNVVIDDAGGCDALSRLAAAGTSGGAHFWAQLSHSGRQVSAEINPAPLSCSSVEIEVIRGAGFNFARPIEMTGAQIHHAIDQFAFAARTVRDAGFTGVSLHAAHGYLISQFLSPLSNRRADGWGGTLANRSRFLLEVIAAVRGSVGPHFPIGIKLNASDFQKGGFNHTECVELVRQLNDMQLDLLELSGGTLEQPKVVGLTVRDEGEDGPRANSAAREAYFVALAGSVRAVARMPVMVTGGFRTANGMIEALHGEELDVVGLGRPLIAEPEAARRLLVGEIDTLHSPERKLNPFHILPWNNMQLERLGDGRDPDLELAGDDALTTFAALERRNLEVLLRYRRDPAGQSLAAPTDNP